MKHYFHHKNCINNIEHHNIISYCVYYLVYYFKFLKRFSMKKLCSMKRFSQCFFSCIAFAVHFSYFYNMCHRAFSIYLLYMIDWLQGSQLSKSCPKSLWSPKCTLLTYVGFQTFRDVNQTNIYIIFNLVVEIVRDTFH